jgi:hypothetical protein
VWINSQMPLRRFGKSRVAGMPGFGDLPVSSVQPRFGARIAGYSASSAPFRLCLLYVVGPTYVRWFRI